MNKKLFIIIPIAIILIGGLIFAGVKIFQNKFTGTTTSSSKKGDNIGYYQNEEENIKEEDNSMYSKGLHHATIEVKNYGTIKLELDADTAPITVANFAKLVNEGFYDGLTFHRIIDGFMIQGGDPLGNGTGGSSEKIKGEFKLNGVKNNIAHVRGVISMARASAYNSASSQFFIVHEDSPHLDGQYAAFGYVTEGIEIVDKVCEDSEPTDNNGTIKADEQPVITSITIRTE